jgi:hypothetical protein
MRSADDRRRRRKTTRQGSLVEARLSAAMRGQQTTRPNLPRTGQPISVERMRPVGLLPLFASLVVLAGELPPHQMIEEAYFSCSASRSLQGGIFGKGPLRKFGPQPGQCSANQWRRIKRSEFKALASKWHGVDWSKDIPFFREDRADPTR